MNPLKCLALDDEPLALGLLSEYIRKTPFLELSDACDNAVAALNVIHNKQIDLIFSDIQMNDLSGPDRVGGIHPWLGSPLGSRIGTLIHRNPSQFVQRVKVAPKLKFQQVSDVALIEMRSSRAKNPPLATTW